MIDIKPAILRDASYVTAHLRQSDVDEVMCQVPEDTKRHEVAHALLTSGDSYVATYKGQPIALFGWGVLNAAAVSVWAIGTDQMARAMPAVTNYFRNVIGPELVADGYLVMEARSHTEHDAAHRWMHSTGAVAGVKPYIYGRNGEKFITFRWTAEGFAANKGYRKKG